MVCAGCVTAFLFSVPARRAFWCDCSHRARYTARADASVSYPVEGLLLAPRRAFSFFLSGSGVSIIMLTRGTCYRGSLGAKRKRWRSVGARRGVVVTYISKKPFVLLMKRRRGQIFFAAVCRDEDGGWAGDLLLG